MALLRLLAQFWGQVWLTIERCEYVAEDVLENLVRERWCNLRDRS